MEVSKVKVENDLVTVEDVKALGSLIMTTAMQIKRDSDQHGAGKTLSEARKQATEEIGSRMLPPVTGKELESMLAKARSALYNEKRIAGIRATAARKREAKAEELTQRLLDAEKLRKTTLPEKSSHLSQAEIDANLAYLRKLKEQTDWEKELEDRETAEMDGSSKAHSSKVPREKRARVVDLYREWVQGNDTIPLDGELAHFNGKTPEAFGFARSVLKKEGYAFERKGGRWFVIARPEEKKYSEKDVQTMIAKFMKEYESSK